MKKKYSVKNTDSEQRRFWSVHAGTWITLNPKETVITTSPPSEQNHIFQVKVLEDKPKKTDEGED